MAAPREAASIGDINPPVSNETPVPRIAPVIAPEGSAPISLVDVFTTLEIFSYSSFPSFPSGTILSKKDLRAEFTSAPILPPIPSSLTKSPNLPLAFSTTS